MKNFYSASPKRVSDYLAARGYSQSHVNRLYTNYYGIMEGQTKAKTQLPKKLIEDITRDFYFTLPTVNLEQCSRYDGTVKFLLKFPDGAQVEAVLMPEQTRITLCVSSQVGCRQACSFCHTGRMGLSRNLEAGEIISQVLAANKWVDNHPGWIAERSPAAGKRVSNIVFMGMGEPLDNCEELAEAVALITHPNALGIAPRRVTVSTAGHLNGLKTFLGYQLGTSIALSLHTADNMKRSRLMPINRRYPIKLVIDYLKQIQSKQKDHVMVQYTVISGVNDSKTDAQNLVEMLKGLRVKVNLIPLNPIRGMNFNEPAPEHLKKFQDLLYTAGLRTMIRYSKGQDIAAACGQLVTDASKSSCN